LYKLRKLVFKYAHLIHAQTLNLHFHFQNIFSLCQSYALASFRGPQLPTAKRETEPGTCTALQAKSL